MRASQRLAIVLDDSQSMSLPDPSGKTRYAVVNIKSLGSFAAGSVIDPDGLAKAGLIKRSGRGRVKILGDGDVAHTLTVRVHAISAAARAKIEGHGGRIEVLAIKEKVAAS